MKANHPNYDNAFETVIAQRKMLRAAVTAENNPPEINISPAEQEELLN